LASKKTKASVLAALRAELAGFGYSLFKQEPDLSTTEYRRELTEDVVVGLQVDFFDGPYAGANLVSMRASFGIASRDLLAIYYKLHNERPRDDYLPIGGSLSQFAPSEAGGCWSFEVPARMEHVRHFVETVQGPFEDLVGRYDTAGKQIERLLLGKTGEAWWNDYFFAPIGYLYLSQGAEAVAAAKRTIEGDTNELFVSSYRKFYERVVIAAGQLSPPANISSVEPTAPSQG
jgi:hypothetical protein